MNAYVIHLFKCLKSSFARTEKGEEIFFVLRGRNDEAINQQILFAIGQPVTVSGRLKRFDDWMAQSLCGLPKTGFITPR